MRRPEVTSRAGAAVVFSLRNREGAKGRMFTPHLSLIVPAFNEVGSIGRTLEAMRSYFDEQKYTL
jgi:hypothetical protein